MGSRALLPSGLISWKGRMKKVTPEEIRALLSKDGPTRYSYFVKQVADTEQVWGLREPDGWVSVSDDSEIPMLPVWPHREYAELFHSMTTFVR